MVKIVVIVAVAITALTVLSTPAPGQNSYPIPNHQLVQLKEICTTGRKTYGANEYAKDGKICRWVYAPYQPMVAK